jgi:hypothetical protein
MSLLCAPPPELLLRVGGDLDRTAANCAALYDNADAEEVGEEGADDNEEKEDGEEVEEEVDAPSRGALGEPA